MGARNIYNEQAVPQWRSLFFYICGFSPHVGTSPYVGTCRGKSGLGFSDVLQHVRTFGGAAGYDDGSPSLVFWAMPTP